MKELVLDNEYVRLKAKTENNKIIFEISNPESECDLILDRNQAHLLKLWLEERLK
jgi:uncharacterized protein Yka (UPF0111/DUF47 family)